MILCCIVLALSFGGLLALQAISSQVGERIHQDPSYYVKRQGLWLFIALLAMLFFASIPLKVLARLSPLAMLLCIFLLVLVFIPGIGRSVDSPHGNFSRWISLGFFNMQPSELSKLALVNFMAFLLSSNAEGSLGKAQALGRQPYFFPFYRFKFMPVLLIAVMLLAILVEPQFGTTICMLGLIFLMLYLAGMSLVRLLSFGFALLPLLAILALLSPYRFERLYVWLDPYRYRFEGGYQLVSSFRAFRESGWWGQELASGAAHRYLSHGHTDFVIALFAENFGWIGLCLLLLLFGALMWRSLHLLKKPKIALPFF